jgi:uncharacterized membrane protein YhaH (DUF805 family)
MSHGWMLFGFDGRLSRKPYWIGSIEVLIAAMLVVGGVAAVLSFTGQAATPEELLRLAHPWLAGVGLILAYPAAALLAKRLHDRNRTGWLAGLLLVPLEVETWLDPAGSVAQTRLIYAIYLAASAMTIVVGVWFLVELGFLRGTVGNNRYGPDPLAVAPEGEQVRGIAP